MKIRLVFKNKHLNGKTTSGKISGFFISANNSYFKMDGAQ